VTTERRATALVERYDAFLFDLDGVVYRGEDPVPHARDVLSDLRQRGRTVRYLTNNSSRTQEQVAAKLAGLGVPATPDEVVTSAAATSAMLRGQGFEGAAAFVIGERGIREALERSGIRIVDGEPPRADLVVVGFDRSFDYDKLRRATLLVRAGARLIATNGDATYPAKDGLWPGAGALLAAVVTATGATPTVVGKPARPMFRSAQRSCGATHPLVIGDRLDTDIGGAAAMGWDSLLVLTGASAPRDLIGIARSNLPTYLGKDLRTLLAAPPAARFRDATPADAGAIADLLGTAGLAAGSGDDGAGSEVTFDEDGSLVATAALDTLGDAALLRSVAVRPDLRRTGLGSLAVAAAISNANARRDRVRTIWLLTETAPRFFERLGFSAADRSGLPGAIASSPAATGCRDGTVMRFDLPPPAS
jgi:HAD superfamily hydrolase (TIGR01457 family)